MELLIVVAAFVGIIGLFTVLSGIVWLIERYVPGATEYLDRHLPDKGGRGW